MAWRSVPSVVPSTKFVELDQRGCSSALKIFSSSSRASLLCSALGLWLYLFRSRLHSEHWVVLVLLHGSLHAFPSILHIRFPVPSCHLRIAFDNPIQVFLAILGTPAEVGIRVGLLT